MALVLCLLAAIYVAVLTGVRRITLIGHGYESLSRQSRTFALLTGQPAASKSTDDSCLARVLDMPAQNLPTAYPLAVLLMLFIALLSLWNTSTLDGRYFSWFVRFGTFTALGLGLLQLAQGLATWNAARSHLKRLARLRVEPYFVDVAPDVTWDISLAPPRLTDLMPVARLADCVMREFRTLSLADPAYLAGGPERRRNVEDFSALQSAAERRLGFRVTDMTTLKPLFGKPAHVEVLELEMKTRQHAALIQSTAWIRLWRLSDAIVGLLEHSYWLRASPARGAAEAEFAEAGSDGKGQKRRRDASAAAADSGIGAPRNHPVWGTLQTFQAPRHATDGWPAAGASLHSSSRSSCATSWRARSPVCSPPCCA